MIEAKLGLLLITPTLLVFMAFMYRQGAMNAVGAIAAGLLSVAIATVLFLNQ